MTKKIASDSTVLERNTRDKRRSQAVFETRSVFYLLCVGLHHDVAVDEDGADDGAGEEGVGEHVDGDPDQRGEDDDQNYLEEIWEIYRADVDFGWYGIKGKGEQN